MSTLDKLRSADFSPYLNQAFHLHQEGMNIVSLELVEVMEIGSATRPEARMPFSIQFLGPIGPQYLAQGTYCLEHEHMGALDVFIVPLGPQEGRMRYEAIFT
jgi:hypothetical protein